MIDSDYSRLSNARPGCHQYEDARMQRVREGEEEERGGGGGGGAMRASISNGMTHVYLYEHCSPHDWWRIPLSQIDSSARADPLAVIISEHVARARAYNRLENSDSS